MKKYFLFNLVFLSFNIAISQKTLWECSMQSTLDTLILTPMINVTQPLVMVYIDFKDGRLSNGSAPTQDSDTSLVLNIDAVGSMGYVNIDTSNHDGQAPKRKKNRKYVYEDYWNMIFSSNTYSTDFGTVHPDRSYLQGHDPDGPNIGEPPYDLTIYGSLRDYWYEVSYGNLTVQAGNTHVNNPVPHYGTGAMYSTGIVNRIDTANGKNYIRWITLDSNKSYYQKGGQEIQGAAIAKIISLHNFNPNDSNYIEFNYYAYSGKIGFVIAGGIKNEATNNEISGYAKLGGNFFVVSEKMAYLGNKTSSSIFSPMAEATHEFGHTIGIVHQAVGPYDLMFWGGLGDRRYYFCPPHINPQKKLQLGWLSANDTIRVNSTRSLTLPSITSSLKKVGIVTLYGDAGRYFDWMHSEYFLLEYRKREKFNRFTGGHSSTFGSDSGGVLIWHYSKYNNFTFRSKDDVRTDFGLKVQNYDTTFIGNPGETSQLYYSSHNLIDSSTIPNTNSIGNTKTGIKISNFTKSSGNMQFDVTYCLGAVPTYNTFITGNISDQTLSGRIFWARVPIGYGYFNKQCKNIYLVPGSILELPPNFSMPINGINAIGTSNNKIIIKGVGFGSNEAKWDGIILTNNNDLYESNYSYLKNCEISGSSNGIILLDPGHRFEIENNLFINNDNDITCSALESENTNIFPKIKNNSAKVKVENRIWAVQNNDTILIPSSGSLIVNSGTILKMGSGSNIISYGKVSSVGTSDYQIVFTTSASSPNSWGNVVLDGNGADNSDFEYCRFERGGEVQVLNGADVTIQHSTFRKMNRAVYFYNSAPILRYNDIDSVVADGFKGTTNYSWPKVIQNTIKRGYGDKNYSGMLFTGTNGNVSQNDIQGFNTGFYMNGGSSPEFNIHEGNTPNPNNRSRLCYYGLKATWGSNPVVGDQDIAEGCNSIYDNTYYNIWAGNSSYVLAENNFFGCGPSYKIGYASGSYVSTEAMLTDDPFGEINCGSGSSQIAEAIQVNAVSNTNATEVNLRKEYKKGLQFKKQKNYGLAMDHFKAMYKTHTLPVAALAQLTTLYDDNVDNGVYNFFEQQKNSNTKEKPYLTTILAKLNQRQGNYNKALRLFDEIISNYPETEEGKDARFQKFYDALHREKNKDKSFSLLNELLSHYSGEDVESAKWEYEHAIFDIPTETSNISLQKQRTQEKKSAKSIKVVYSFALNENYPNPFNPTTTISYSIPEPNIVKLIVYDYIGREVTTLVNEYKNEGKYNAVFNASKLSSGVYFYRLQSGNNVSVKKMVLLK